MNEPSHYYTVCFIIELIKLFCFQQSHNYTVLEQALIHEEILQICGIQKVHLLAHDLGDTVAQEMLARCVK